MSIKDYWKIVGAVTTSILFIKLLDVFAYVFTSYMLYR